MGKRLPTAGLYLAGAGGGGIDPRLPLHVKMYILAPIKQKPE